MGERDSECCAASPPFGRKSSVCVRERESVSAVLVCACGEKGERERESDSECLIQNILHMYVRTVCTRTGNIGEQDRGRQACGPC